MTARVEVRGKVLRWACERAGGDVAVFSRKFPKLPAWVRGEWKPTLKQLEGFAKATRTPVGFLFLPEPPVERVPIQDLRTIGNERLDQPSPDLLDTLYLCQQRQEWYRGFARTMREDARPFVGSARLSSDIEETAAEIRQALGFDLEERRRLPRWIDALRRFVDQADSMGVLVMVTSIVGNNSHRHLDPEEFRGFALSDDLAPLVFVNGADTKAAQMFTLAHELAHLWLGETALSDVGPISTPSDEVEVWCNRVAAELLVPLAVMQQEYRPEASLREELDRLARRFKVSTLVVLRRIHDAGGLTGDQLWELHRDELQRLRGMERRRGGGDFYRTQAARVGKRFARAMVASTFEGRSSYTEAFRLLGVRKMSTFEELAHTLGMDL